MLNRRSFALQFSSLVSLLAFGCDSDQSHSEPPREVFVVIPDSGPMISDIRRELKSLILKRLPPSSYVHILNGRTHDVICTISVPDQWTVAASRNASSSMLLLDRFLAAAATKSATEVHTNLPRLWNRLASDRMTDAAPEILVIANPLYHDDEEPKWTMVPNRCPTPTTLSNQGTPWGRPIQPIPAGAQLIIAAVDPNWGVSGAHCGKVESFYRYAMQNKIKGHLQPIVLDVKAAFDRLASRDYSTYENAEVSLAPENGDFIEFNDPVWSDVGPYQIRDIKRGT